MFCLYQARCQQRNFKQGYDCGQHQHLAKVPAILDFFDIEIISDAQNMVTWPRDHGPHVFPDPQNPLKVGRWQKNIIDMGTTKIVWQQTRFISEHRCQAGYDLTINSHTNISVIEVCVQFPEQMPFCHTKNKIGFFILCDSKNPL